MSHTMNRKITFWITLNLNVMLSYTLVNINLSIWLFDNQPYIYSMYFVTWRIMFIYLSPFHGTPFALFINIIINSGSQKRQCTKFQTSCRFRIAIPKPQTNFVFIKNKLNSFTWRKNNCWNCIQIECVRFQCRLVYDC
jgi:hypothetical protein